MSGDFDNSLKNKLFLSESFISENFTKEDFENENVFIEKLHKIVQADDILDKKNEKEINNFLVKILDNI